MEPRFPPLSEFSFAQCSLIERHPVFALIAFGSWYLFSLVALQSKLHYLSNLILLLYLAIIMFGVGAPLMRLA